LTMQQGAILPQEVQVQVHVPPSHHDSLISVDGDEEK
jgi:hypothetical protein